MISTWWLLLFIPVSLTVGYVLAFLMFNCSLEDEYHRGYQLGYSSAIDEIAKEEEKRCENCAYGKDFEDETQIGYCSSNDKRQYDHIVSKDFGCINFTPKQEEE